MKRERIRFNVVEKSTQDDNKSKNRNKQSPIAIPEHILFEYFKNEDTIYFSNSIQLQDRSITSIKNCSKSSTWVTYIHTDDIPNVIEVFQSKEGSTTEFRCMWKDELLWFRISLMKSGHSRDEITYLLGSFDNIQEEKTYIRQKEQWMDHATKTALVLLELMKKVNVVDELMSLWTQYFEQLKRGIEQQRRKDPLTNLNHIDEFLRISHRFLSAKEDAEIYAVVSIDFMQFRYVNRQCGSEIADQILCDYARELERFEPAICVGREFADHFVMLIKGFDIYEMKQAVTRMNKLFMQRQAQKLHGFKLYIVAGIYQLKDNDEFSFALDQARYARKNIKNIYETNTCIYKEEMLQSVNRKLEIISLQENALQNHEFEVYLQPKIDLQKNQIVGAEALLRWNRMDGTLMFPDEFIPIFEQNGFIIPIDFYVYETVCQLIQKWQVQLNKSIPISVNVSRAHLTDSNFADDIERLVKQYKIPNELLELELTETMVLDCVEDAVDMMKRLQELGFIVSIDDFGSGYSSLNLLKDFKTNILKIDKEFFRRGDLQEQDKIIVMNIIRMAKQLNMKVLSEGVETTMQSEFLRDCCCDMAQGYLYAKPMPVAEFEKYMMEYSM